MTKRVKIACLLLSLLVQAGYAADTSIPVYKNAKAPIHERVEDLLGRMTLEEKLFQLGTYFPNACVRLDIPYMAPCEALHGVVYPKATVFPQAIAMASTFDVELVERIGNCVAQEARAMGVHHAYSPNIGVLRDPRWGRTDETYGEDPYLVSRMAVAYINGLQGKGDTFLDENHIIATAKHFIADAQPDGGRNGAAMDVSDRVLREVFLPPYEAAIKEAHVGAIMPAHHVLNGIPCHAHDELINGVLRGEYGFDGFVMSDNGDIGTMHGYPHLALWIAETKEDAARLALEAGVDCELAWKSPYRNRFYAGVLFNAVKTGVVSQALVNQAVKRILTAKFRLGLFDNDQPTQPVNDLKYLSGIKGHDVDEHVKDPFAYADVMLGLKDSKLVFDGTQFPRPDCNEVLYDKSHDTLALEAARRAIVLLNNEGGLLPLDKKKIKTLAVIGPNADAVVFGSYSNRDPKYTVTVLQGIQTLVGRRTKVLHAQGCDFDNNNPATELIAEAVKTAQQSDAVILVIGGNNETCKENQDNDSVELTGAQEALAQAVAETGKPVVVTLVHGRPHAIGWIAEHIPAILDCWYLGQEAGTAVAEALFGRINPGAKLPLTVPRNTGQLPCYYNYLPMGRRANYYQAEHQSLWPFGFGLSYTTFTLSDLKVEPIRIPRMGKATVTVTVKNTGKRAGDEVVQLYLRDEYSSVARPVKELKGFQRVHLKPGQRESISFEIGTDALKFWKNGQWIVEPGSFKLMVGPNSEELKSVQLEVKTPAK